MSRVYFLFLLLFGLMGIALSFEKPCAWYIGLLVSMVMYHVIVLVSYFLMKNGGVGPIGGY